MTIPAELARVDHALLATADRAGRLVTAISTRLNTALANPATDGETIAHLRAALDHAKQTVGTIRYRSHGIHGLDTTPVAKAIRGAAGQFAAPSSRGHFEQHRKQYHTLKADGAIKGTRSDYRTHISAGWQTEQESVITGLLQDMRHAEAEARGLVGKSQRTARRRIATIAARLTALGYQF